MIRVWRSEVKVTASQGHSSPARSWSHPRPTCSFSNLVIMLMSYENIQSSSFASLLWVEHCSRVLANSFKTSERETLLIELDCIRAVSSISVRRCATKQMLIYAPPAVLTVHLKRFEQVGSSLRRLSRHVEFGELLDLTPYCSRLAEVVTNIESCALCPALSLNSPMSLKSPWI